MALAPDPLWYKDAVIYQVHVKSFFDSNNDGIGDFRGLTEKLDYVASLGVNAIWLLPFYPSPRRDDGYDIADYRGIEPSYGNFRDFRQFVQAAHSRGIRVITELVINHTSDQHPWFQRARRAKPGSVARDFYVWRDDDKGYPETRIIFLDTEKSNWAWDEVAGAYFWHRFYSHQPDLNFDNPRVLESLLSVLRFWLAAGVDGLRLDAIPYLVEREGTINENLPETHEVIRRVRAEVDRRYPGKMLLAEANQWPEDVQEYFGQGDECHMAFHFPLMPRMYMAVAQEDRYPITDILRQTPSIPENCQWAIFLRNHDELTLEMVTDQERDYLWRVYASNPRARINLGIRRRLAPLMDRDRRRIELMTNLLLSMPGTPVMYYGDEIGMGDNIYLGDRDGVRTPMQWSPDRNGGFSRADPARLVLPPIMDPLYGYGAINVEAQSSDPHSLLNWTRRLVAVRQSRRTFGRGELVFLYPGNRKVLAYIREYEGESILCVSNLARTAQSVELDLRAYNGRVPIEMIGRTAFPPIGELPYLVTLPPYGFFWFLLAADAEVPTWHTPTPMPMPDFITLVLRQGVGGLTQGEPRELLEGNILPTYLPLRRWFSAKSEKLRHARIAAATPMPPGAANSLFVEIDAETGAGDRYFLPMSLVFDDRGGISPEATQLALARARQGRRVGLLTDATSTDSFVVAVVTALANKTRLTDPEAGDIEFRPSSRFQGIDTSGGVPVMRLSLEQSNSTVIIDSKVVLKFIRRTYPGHHPEAEMSRYLTEVAGFQAVAPFLGDIVRHEPNGAERLLCIAQGFVRNQGDGWVWLREQLKNLLSGGMPAPLTPTAVAEPGAEAVEAELPSRQFIRALAKRIGELHLALAQPSDNPDFAPEPVTAADAKAWTEAATRELGTVMRLLTASDVAQGHKAVRELASREDQLADLIAERGTHLQAGLKTRIHGDLHLGQVLVTAGDAVIVDFEGEPARPLSERRAKFSPARDVAGVVRSIDYLCRVAAMDYASAHADTGGGHAPPALDAWRESALQDFLDIYFETVGDCPVWPADRTEGMRLLDFFVAWKAVYELGYELNNRPGWACHPAEALLGLLSASKR
jgi:maltose alpha-D-glucosyltransferase/alpha-amylase